MSFSVENPRKKTKDFKKIEKPKKTKSTVTTPSESEVRSMKNAHGRSTVISGSGGSSRGEEELAAFASI